MTIEQEMLQLVRDALEAFRADDKAALFKALTQLEYTLGTLA